jgi:hypothetical protein
MFICCYRFPATPLAERGYNYIGPRGFRWTAGGLASIVILISGSARIDPLNVLCGLHFGFLLGLLFDPKDEGGKFLRNVSELLPK